MWIGKEKDTKYAASSENLSHSDLMTDTITSFCFVCALALLPFAIYANFRSNLKLMCSMLEMSYVQSFGQDSIESRSNSNDNNNNF